MESEEIIYSLPIEHLSYSALKAYCNNRAMFKKIYILQQGDFKVSPSMMVGKMAHKFAEFIFEGEEYDKAIEAGHAELDRTPDSDFYDPEKVDRENIKQEYTKAITHFMEEKPNVGEVIATELNITTDFLLDGKQAPLPIKAVTDLVTRMPDGIHLWDYKFTTRPREADQEQPDYILQSVFNRITVGSHIGEQPKAMHFVQVKIPKNRDGGPQVEIYTIEFDKHPEYFTYFDRMYRGFIKEVISPHVQFLPNFSDYLSGQESWEEFTEGLIDFDLPQKIDHSTSLNIQRNKGKIRESVDFIKSKASLLETSTEEKIRSKLLEFAINLQYVEKFVGANVTLYTYEPSRGVSMVNLARYEADLELVLGAKSVTIHAPLKGKKLVGIEVSNEEQSIIEFGDQHKPKTKGSLEFAVGEDVYGNTRFIDIAKAPHILVAGATGMGKSVFLNVMLTTILNNNNTQALEVVLIDPKGNEFYMYEDDPKVVSVSTEIKDANEILKQLTDTMTDRYKKLKKAKVQDIDAYNNNAKKNKMKKMVVVIDELADLILSKETYQAKEVIGKYKNGKPKTRAKNVLYAKEIENSLVRLAQKARAVGIHLVCATQRPSVDVVLGVLKANFPTRVAFATVTATDSQVIIDQTGAEKLIGNGDLLLMTKSCKYLERLQGIFI
jgi:hypothetical protein